MIICRSLARRQVQIQLLLLLLTCCALVSQLASSLSPRPHWAGGSADDTSTASDAASAGSQQSSNLLVTRRPRRNTKNGSLVAPGRGPGRTVYVVTATYPRPEQEADLLRLAQTLMHVPFVFWVVVEDAVQKTPVVAELLKRSGLQHVHLLGEMPPDVKKERFWGRVPRGVSNRNTGLAWLREHATDGVAYFADDDNTYDIRLFAELQQTHGVSVFPVGLVTQLGVSSPVVQDGRVVAFFDGWQGGRLFAMDMAGFAVSIDLLRKKPEAKMPYMAGYEEDGFLQALGVSRSNLEPLASNCTQILVWHTQTQKVEPFQRTNQQDFADTNIEHLIEHLKTGTA